VSFLSVIPESEASPELKQIYEELKGTWGFVPNYFLASGKRPELIRLQTALYEAIYAKGVLPQKLKEEIGVVVAGINASSYRVAYHMEVLRRMGIERALSRKLAVDYENAPVEPAAKALFRFAAKLTKTPCDITKHDIELLKTGGRSEDAVYETVMTVAMMSLFNRVSLGLGLVADL